VSGLGTTLLLLVWRSMGLMGLSMRHSGVCWGCMGISAKGGEGGGTKGMHYELGEEGLPYVVG